MTPPKRWLLLSILFSLASAVMALIAGGFFPNAAGILALLGTLCGFFAYLTTISDPRDKSQDSGPIPSVVLFPDVPIEQPIISAVPNAPNRSLNGIADAYALIPYAKAILQAVPVKTEEATLRLIEQCMAIKDKSQREATLSQESLNAFNDLHCDSSIPLVIENTRNAINQERENIGAMLNGNKYNTDRLRAMSAEIDSGIELLRGIEDITQRSWVIAINLAVEAGHIGEKGRGFQVIAGELHSLNNHSVAYAEKVGHLLARFKEYNTTLIGALVDQTSSFANQVEKGFQSSLNSITSLQEVSTHTGQNAAAVATQSLEIDADLQKLLESLQFQDITRQMVEGALTILDELNGHLEKLKPVLEDLDSDIFNDYVTRRETLRKILVDRSKTMDEKKAITGVQ